MEENPTPGRCRYFYNRDLATRSFSGECWQILASTNFNKLRWNAPSKNMSQSTLEHAGTGLLLFKSTPYLVHLSSCMFLISFIYRMHVYSSTHIQVAP